MVNNLYIYQRKSKLTEKRQNNIKEKKRIVTLFLSLIRPCKEEIFSFEINRAQLNAPLISESNSSQQREC